MSDWKVLFCSDCQQCFLIPGSSRRSRKRCDPCQEVHQSAKNREYVQKHRALTADTDMGKLQQSTPQKYTLICQHQKLFRMPLTEGEEIWCERCDSYREYTAGIQRQLCFQQKHRMTPFNSIYDPSLRRTACRRCVEAEKGLAYVESIIHDS